MGLGEMPGARQGHDEAVKLRLQPVEASVDVGAQPGESANEHANEHTERDREQDTDERGIRGPALALRIGRRLWRIGINKESRPRQRHDERIDLSLQPLDPGIRLAMVGTVLSAKVAEVGAEQVEGTREHAEQGRDHDADERGRYGGIHGAALALRIGRRRRGTRWRRADWESGLCQRQDQPVELPLEPVDPRVRLAIIRAEIAEVGAEQVERSGEHAEQRGAQDANERGGNRRIHDPNLL